MVRVKALSMSVIGVDEKNGLRSSSLDCRLSNLATTRIMTYGGNRTLPKSMRDVSLDRPAIDDQGATVMDSHRSRRTRDQARKAWYAYYRQVRFTRWLGFIGGDANLDRGFLDRSSTTCPKLDEPGPFLEPHLNASC